MGFLIGVEIDNSRLVWIHDSAHTSTRAVRLTTVVDNQHKADIKFYIKNSGKKSFLCAETITGLPPMKAGEPSIDIKPRISGKTFLYEIYVNGKLVRRSTCSLAKYIRTKTPFIITRILAAAIFILLGLLYLKPVISDDKNNAKVAEPAASQQPAEQNPSENPEPSAAPVPTPEEAVKESAVPPPAEIQPAEKEPEPVPVTAKPVFIESEITDRHSVYFQPESSELTAEAIQGLDCFINELPGKGDFTEASFELEVRGHCARYGTEEGRAELSNERALTVYKYLKTAWGIEADSLVTGAGASEPVTLEIEEQHLNRRVDINIRGNLKKLTQ